MKLIKLIPAYKYYLWCGTNIASAVVDEYGNIYGRSWRKTTTPRLYNETFDDMALCAKEAGHNSGIK